MGIEILDKVDVFELRTELEARLLGSFDKEAIIFLPGIWRNTFEEVDEDPGTQPEEALATSIGEEEDSRPSRRKRQPPLGIRMRR